MGNYYKVLIVLPSLDKYFQRSTRYFQLDCLQLPQNWYISSWALIALTSLPGVFSILVHGVTTSSVSQVRKFGVILELLFFFRPIASQSQSKGISPHKYPHCTTLDQTITIVDLGDWNGSIYGISACTCTEFQFTLCNATRSVFLKSKPDPETPRLITVQFQPLYCSFPLTDLWPYIIVILME